MEPGDGELLRLDALLTELTSHLQEAVDLSLRLAARSPSEKKRITGRWEMLLGSFYGHIRRRSRETGVNLLGWLSFSRITAL